MANSKVLYCLFWLSLGLSVQGNEFDTANQLYDQGKFEEAKAGYEKLIEGGAWSANLFYNLGNTDYRLGAPGRAMLNYERALALQSGHVEARANLRWMREQNGSKVAPQVWWEYALAPVSASVFALLGALAGWGAVFSATISLIGRRSWVWFGLGLLVAGYCAAGVWWREREAGMAIITAKEAVARVAPADRAALADTLAAGSRVRILSERGEWIYCALAESKRGWIASGELEIIPLKK